MLLKASIQSFGLCRQKMKTPRWLQHRQPSTTQFASTMLGPPCLHKIVQHLVCKLGNMLFTEQLKKMFREKKKKKGFKTTPVSGQGIKEAPCSRGHWRLQLHKPFSQNFFFATCSDCSTCFLFFFSWLLGLFWFHFFLLHFLKNSPGHDILGFPALVFVNFWFD